MLCACGRWPNGERRRRSESLFRTLFLRFAAARPPQAPGSLRPSSRRSTWAPRPDAAMAPVGGLSCAEHSTANPVSSSRAGGTPCAIQYLLRDLALALLSSRNWRNVENSDFVAATSRKSATTPRYDLPVETISIVGAPGFLDSSGRWNQQVGDEWRASLRTPLLVRVTNHSGRRPDQTGQRRTLLPRHCACFEAPPSHSSLTPRRLCLRRRR